MKILSTILIYALPIGFLIAFAIYTKWQIIDEDDGPGWKTSDRRWHKAGLVMRIFVALIGAVWVFLPAPDPDHFLIVLPIGAAAFDIGINIARGRGILDFGNSFIDRSLKRWKWAFYLLWIIVTILILSIF